MTLPLSVRAWLKESGYRVMPWCARSPDLNPIENLWSWMDSKLCKTQLTTVEQLKEAIDILWKNVPPELCMNLIESMPKRVKACYKAHGGYFKY